MYERLGMPQEYIYTFRMIIVVLLHQSDFVKLRTILDPFKSDSRYDSAVFAKMWNGERLFD